MAVILAPASAKLYPPVGVAVIFLESSSGDAGGVIDTVIEVVGFDGMDEEEEEEDDDEDDDDDDDEEEEEVDKDCVGVKVVELIVGDSGVDKGEDTDVVEICGDPNVIEDVLGD